MPQSVMNKQFSIYLDFLRFTAACLVFISHVPRFAGGWGWQIAGFGHEAVVIFFVLSGFVISYVVFDRKESALKYSVSRLSRIYSVAIPAIILTTVLYYLGSAINPSAFAELNLKLNSPIWTITSALFFLNQSWLATPVFSNLPYWSLGYEVLYYVFFGFLIYTQGSVRIILLIALSCIMGPSILLYLPIWLAGVLCFKASKRYHLTLKLSLFLFVLSVIGIVFFFNSDIQAMVNTTAHNFIGDHFYQFLLEPAELFAADYVLCVFVCVNIFSAYNLAKYVRDCNQRIEFSIRTLSAHTFSLYLFHMPMLYFISAIFPYELNPVLNLIFAWICTPVLIFILSNYTENKKENYKTFFYSMFHQFAKLKLK
jgi:peptidoglycan/LPS O-acetylase OafA/YrhL